MCNTALTRKGIDCTERTVQNKYVKKMLNVYLTLKNPYGNVIISSDKS